MRKGEITLLVQILIWLVVISFIIWIIKIYIVDKGTIIPGWDALFS
jgi:hypothetical protein